MSTLKLSMKLKIKLKDFLRFRWFSTQTQCTESSRENILNVKPRLPVPEYDIKFLCNPSNRDYIARNIKLRKGIGDIDKVLSLSQMPECKNSFLKELSKIPNDTYPVTYEYGDKPKLLKECGSKQTFVFEPTNFSHIAKKLKLIRTQELSPITGSRSYILLGDLAELENALIHYTIEKIMKHGFKLVSVPDIIPTEVIERCGLIPYDGRNLIYNLDKSYGTDLSLSGTAEMSLAAKLMNSEICYEDLPLKLAAVSRCYRSEVSQIMEEKGLYRVHHFTKVEMFVCSEENKSSEVFQFLLDVQEEIFTSLGLHIQILDMPAHELGASAYRKVDVEGWMPGRQKFGELSSCSNCTDYQSRRLNIKYKLPDGNTAYVHTLNGTACAVPRMIIAFCETYQTKHGRIYIPEMFQPYMNGKQLIRKQPFAEMKKYMYVEK